MIEQLSASIIPGIVAKGIYESEVVRDNARNLERCVQIYEHRKSLFYVNEFVRAANFHEKIRKAFFFAIGSGFDVFTYAALLNSAYYLSENKRKEAVTTALIAVGVRLGSAFSSKYIRKKAENKINEQYEKLNNLMGDEGANRVFEKLRV